MENKKPLTQQEIDLEMAYLGLTDPHLKADIESSKEINQPALTPDAILKRYTILYDRDYPTVRYIDAIEAMQKYADRVSMKMAWVKATTELPDKPGRYAVRVKTILGYVKWILELKRETSNTFRFYRDMTPMSNDGLEWLYEKPAP